MFQLRLEHPLTSGLGFIGFLPTVDSIGLSVTRSNSSGSRNCLPGRTVYYRGLNHSTKALGPIIPGLLSNQREKSIHFYFIMVPLRK